MGAPIIGWTTMVMGRSTAAILTARECRPVRLRRAVGSSTHGVETTFFGAIFIAATNDQIAKTRSGQTQEKFRRQRVCCGRELLSSDGSCNALLVERDVGAFCSSSCYASLQAYNVQCAAQPSVTGRVLLQRFAGPMAQCIPWQTVSYYLNLHFVPCHQ